MNILLTNVHSAYNAGDQALMLESLDQIHAAFGEQTAITIVADDPDSLAVDIPAIRSMFGWLQRRHPNGSVTLQPARVLALPLLTWLPLLMFRISGWLPIRLLPPELASVLRAYATSEAVVSVGGGFLYSSARGVTLLLHAYSIFLAQVAGKPVYMLPQSFGPFRKPWECAAIRFVLRKVRVIMVREPVSLQQLLRCKLPKSRLHMVPDLGFRFSSEVTPALQPQANQLLAAISSTQPRMGITVIDWGAQFSDFSKQELYEQAVAEACVYFCERTHGKVIFFPQVCGPTPAQDDRLPARRVAVRLAHLGDSVILLEERYHPAVLKQAYAQMHIFIGTRMHSNIFAISECVPVLAIGYLHKTQGIMQMFGLEKWVFDINTIQKDIVAARLAELLDQRQIVISQIQEQLPAIQSGIASARELIAADIRQRDGQPK